MRSAPCWQPVIPGPLDLAGSSLPGGIPNGTVPGLRRILAGTGHPERWEAASAA